MATALGEIMSLEARSGFRRFVGTRVDARIVLTQAALLETLRRFTDIPRSLTLRIEAGNHIVLGYAGFKAGAVIAEAVDMQHKHLQLWLDSRLVGWALRYLFRSPGVIVTGRRLLIELEHLNVFARYRLAWDQVRAVAVSTAPGTVRVQFEIEVV
jgi:hypothetical protein